MNNFGDKLKRLRHKNNLSLEEVALDLGLNYRTYLSYEHGERKPRIDVAFLISKYYGVSLDWLCDDGTK